MRFIWCTTRHFKGDLCATTQYALIEKLLAMGHEMTVLGPDLPTVNYDWKHVQLHQSTMKGRKASSLSKSMCTYLKNIEDDTCILLIDWALVKHLAPLVEARGIRWICIDRSPPADANIYARFQRNVWKKSWRFVASSLGRNSGCIGGTVVSAAHQKLIMSQFPIEKEKLCIIHAGVDTRLFQPTNRRSLEAPIRMVYHGKMDRHRGILKLILLIDALEKCGVETELNLIGSGDLDQHLTNLGQSKPNLIFHGSIPHSKMPAKLSEYHIGLLPMPNLPAWTISSPLKRSEYVSSGLLILGIDHQGHSLPTIPKETGWYKLFSQESFVDDSVKQIQQWVEEDKFSELSVKARQYAESALDWNITTQPLMELLGNLEE